MLQSLKNGLGYSQIAFIEFLSQAQRIDLLQDNTDFTALYWRCIHRKDVVTDVEIGNIIEKYHVSFQKFQRDNKGRDAGLTVKSVYDWRMTSK